MIPDHLLCAELRRLGKWDLLFKPWCFHHALFSVFHMTAGTIDHISHTVDHPHFNIQIICDANMCCILRNKLRFRCHYNFSGCGLRQFIRQTFFFMVIRQMRQYHKFHETFNKC